jgi:hypothetical protein
VSDTAAEAEQPAGTREYAKPPETVEQAIARLTKEAEAAQKAKDAADSAFADVDGHLTALRNLQKESDKANQAYKAAHDQLEIDQQGFLDYYDSEKDNLEHLLGTTALKAIDTKVQAKRGADKAAADAVTTANNALTAAATQSDESKADRTEKAAAVTRYQQLPATIGAGHTKLKALRDEAVKARQAGLYALAYWLLVSRPEFSSVLEVSAAELIEPDALPAKLLAAVNELAAAEHTQAENDKALAKCRVDLANAQRENAEQQTKGETALREELKNIPAAGAEQTRSNPNA